MVREEFYEEYIKALRQGNAAIFAGAGLSRAAGYVDWRELLADIARDLGLEIDRETDLLAVAQYHFNARQNRGRLNQKLIEEFIEGATLTENHRLIAQLPLQTVWTTNYDKLLEQAFEQADKRVDAKIVSENLATTRSKAEVTVYKMHGDISLPNKAVLLKDDYELYNKEREAFTIQLEAHLISHQYREA
jgi:NAD-dependent SIR2 family protein deacetylase